MTFKQLIKNSIFVNPVELRATNRVPFWMILIQTILLTLILTVPKFIGAYSVFSTLQAEGIEFVNKMPDFSIKDGDLDVAGDEEGFIYQTDNIIFTFDPEGKRTVSDVRSDLVGDLYAIAFLKDRLLFLSPSYSEEFEDGGISSGNVEVLYSDLPTNFLTKARLSSYLNSKIGIMIITLSLMFVWLVCSINYFMMLIIIGLIANIYTKLKRLPFRFGTILKYVTVSMTLPIIVSSIIEILLPSFDTVLFIYLASLYIYMQIFKGKLQVIS